MAKLSESSTRPFHLDPLLILDPLPEGMDEEIKERVRLIKEEQLTNLWLRQFQPMITEHLTHVISELAAKYAIDAGELFDHAISCITEVIYPSRGLPSICSKTGRYNSCPVSDIIGNLSFLDSSVSDPVLKALLHNFKKEKAVSTEDYTALYSLLVCLKYSYLLNKKTQLGRKSHSLSDQLLQKGHRGISSYVFSHLEEYLSYWLGEDCPNIHDTHIDSEGMERQSFTYVEADQIHPSIKLSNKEIQRACLAALSRAREQLTTQPPVIRRKSELNVHEIKAHIRKMLVVQFYEDNALGFCDSLAQLNDISSSLHNRFLKEPLTVRSVSQQGKPPIQFTLNPLQAALFSGCTEVAEALLNLEPSLYKTHDIWTYPQYAREYSHIAVLGSTILDFIIAVISCNIAEPEKVEKLLGLFEKLCNSYHPQFCNINPRQSYFNTALHYAAACPDPRPLEILLGSAQTPRLSYNKKGYLPMDAAIKGQRSTNVELLCSKFPVLATAPSINKIWLKHWLNEDKNHSLALEIIRRECPLEHAHITPLDRVLKYGSTNAIARILRETAASTEAGIAIAGRC